ncbi:MAG: hypothetical protein LBP85_01025 [Prevotellaceae bacterium]|jgi:hypothetical protein|nr:hypothetical protein [Prevotellaceae bacterium]
MNKKVKILTALMSLFAAVATISCSSNNNNDNINTDIINAKWIITTPDSDYASFEFTSYGHYIVIENTPAATTESSSAGKLKSSFLQKGVLVAMNTAATASSEQESNLSPIHHGTYTKNGDVITLTGFGVLTIISITAEQFTFSFTLTENGETGEYTANTSAPPISESERTKLMCRAWTVKDITIDEDAMSEDDKEHYFNKYGPAWTDSLIQGGIDKGILNATALFSRAGTYLVLYAKEDSEAGLAEWKWVNSEEKSFYYSWNNWQDNWDDNIVEIIELNKTSLIFIDTKQFDDRYVMIYNLALKE